MAEIKWIKITTDMFDNRKIKHLRRLPEGNNIVLIWVMLLTMAGRCNSSGMIFLTENIPYTTKMLADELDFEENTVKLALNALEQMNMIVTDNGFFSIAGWDEYQNIEGMEKIREQNRIRQQRRREKTKQALIGDGKTCEYCGREGTTVDHIIPKSKGGADSPENTVCSCLSCNMKKTDRDLDVFLNEMLRTSVDFDLGRILSNQKIMNHVVFDDNISCFVSRDITQKVTHRHATDIEEDKKEKKKQKKEVKTYSDDAELNQAILAFMEFRKSIKKPMTDHAVDLLIGKLNGMTSYIPEQIEIINQSIVNGWQGVFPLKTEQPVRQTYHKQTKADELNDFYAMAASFGEGD